MGASSAGRETSSPSYPMPSCITTTPLRGDDAGARPLSWGGDGWPGDHVRRAGMGDLITTCISPHSRNRHVGEAGTKLAPTCERR